MNETKCVFCDKDGKEKTVLGYWVCGENHNATPAQIVSTPQSTWVERFEEKFVKKHKLLLTDEYHNNYGYATNYVKDFISKEKEESYERGLKERKYEELPRSFGKNTKLLVDFFTEGKKGKSVVFATPEGNFLSPKAVENIIAQAKEEERDELKKKIKEDLDEAKRLYSINKDIDLIGEVSALARLLSHLEANK